MKMSTMDWVRLYRENDRILFKEMAAAGDLPGDATLENLTRSQTWKRAILDMSGQMDMAVPHRSVLLNVACRSSDEAWKLLLQVNETHMEMQVQKHKKVCIILFPVFCCFDCVLELCCSLM